MGIIVMLISGSLSLVLGFYLIGVYKLVAMHLPDVITVGDPIVKFDKRVGFRASENSKTTVTVPKINLSYDLMTDNTGARISPVNRTYPDKPSITLVGCSFTWGHGVSNDETYAHVLETELKMRVRNYGMGSYGTVQSLEMLEKFGVGSSLIIYGFIDEHLRRNVTPCAPSFAPLCLYVPTVRRNSGGAFYIGCDGGIYKTTDNGASFQSLNRGLTLTQFTSIAIHPNDPTISLGGTQDNGTQWRHANNSPSPACTPRN